PACRGWYYNGLNLIADWMQWRWSRMRGGRCRRPTNARLADDAATSLPRRHSPGYLRPLIDDQQAIHCHRALLVEFHAIESQVEMLPGRRRAQCGKPGHEMRGRLPLVLRQKVRVPGHGADLTYQVVRRRLVKWGPGEYHIVKNLG